jgi:hypothetical protein
MNNEHAWADDHNNICLTADYLVNSLGYKAENLLHFIEKPWHYKEQYEAALKDYNDEIAAEKFAKV